MFWSVSIITAKNNYVLCLNICWCWGVIFLDLSSRHSNSDGVNIRSLLYWIWIIQSSVCIKMVLWFWLRAIVKGRKWCQIYRTQIYQSFAYIKRTHIRHTHRHIFSHEIAANIIRLLPQSAENITAHSSSWLLLLLSSHVVNQISLVMYVMKPVTLECIVLHTLHTASCIQSEMLLMYARSSLLLYLLLLDTTRLTHQRMIATCFLSLHG